MKKVMLALTAAVAAGAALFGAPQRAEAQVVSFGFGSGGYYGGYGYGWGAPVYGPVGVGYGRPWRRFAGYPYGYGYGYYPPIVSVYDYPPPFVRRVYYNRPVVYAPRRIVRSRVIYTRPVSTSRHVVRTRAVYSRPAYRSARIVRHVYY
jgi:hypothetical protein